MEAITVDADQLYARSCDHWPCRQRNVRRPGVVRVLCSFIPQREYAEDRSQCLTLLSTPANYLSFSDMEMISN